jgi:hypothetical protein
MVVLKRVCRYTLVLGAKKWTTVTLYHSVTNVIKCKAKDQELTFILWAFTQYSAVVISENQL